MPLNPSEIQELACFFHKRSDSVSLVALHARTGMGLTESMTREDLVAWVEFLTKPTQGRSFTQWPGSSNKRVQMIKICSLFVPFWMVIPSDGSRP